MANLVPLNLDLETGHVVATGTDSGGQPPNSNCVFGYVYQQSTAVLEWTITHSLNTTNVLCQIYDETNTMILPDSVEVISSTEILVTFLVEQAGMANITGLVNCN